MIKDVRVRLNSGLPWQTQHLKRRPFTSKLDLNTGKVRAKFYIWSTDLFGVETLTLRKVDQIYLGNCEMWCRRGLDWCEKWSLMVYVVKEERNILHTIKWRNASWIGHILPSKKRGWRKNIRDGEDEKEDLSSYLMTWTKRENTGRSHFLENSFWKRLMYLLYDRLRDDDYDDDDDNDDDESSDSWRCRVLNS
jgi:hypothetical protein